MSSRAAGRTAGPVTIYVANKAGNTVTPIRAASNRAGRPIRVGPGPELIAISPDGQTAYVVGVGSLLPEEAEAPVTLTAIRTATNRPGRVITVCAPGNLGGVDRPVRDRDHPGQPDRLRLLRRDGRPGARRGRQRV